jgi:hypothetical protein
MEDGIIIIIVKRMPKAILKAKILLILIIEVLASLRTDLSNVVMIVDRTRRSPTTMVWSKLGLPHKRS